jgi:PST family polysaccharide transporter
MVAGRGGGLLASLLTTAMMTRELGPSGYGVYQAAIAYLGLAILLVDFGLPNIFIREISTPGADEQRLVGNAVALRLSVTSTALIIALFTVALLPYSSEEVRGVLYALPGFLAYSLHLMLYGLFQSHLKQTGAVIAELTGVLVLVTSVYVLCQLDATPAVFCAALGGSYIVVLTIALGFANRIVRVRLRFDLQVWRGYLQSALPLAGAMTMTVLAFKLPTVLLAVLSSEDEVGKFGTSQVVLNSLMGVSLLFIGLVAPSLARAAARNRAELSSVLQGAVTALLLGGIGVALVLVSLADPIIALLAGEAFGEASTTLRLFMPLFVIHSLSLLLREAVTAMHEQHRVAPSVAVGLVAALIGFVVLIPRLQGEGAVVSLLVGEVLVAIGLLRVLSRLGAHKAIGSRGRRIILSGGLGLLAMLLCHSARLGPWLTPILTGLAYATALLVTRAVGTGEIRNVVRGLRR